MDHKSVIVVTGAAGFIGSCMVGYLNLKGYSNLVLVDDFSKTVKEPNLADKNYLEKIERDVFFEWLQIHRPNIACIFHLGARTDTTEFDYSIHQRLNVEY